MPMWYGFNAEGMTPANRDKWYVVDWAGNRMSEGDFAAKLWDSFEDAREAVDIHVNNMLDAGHITEEEAEEEHGEYYAYQVAEWLLEQAPPGWTGDEA